MSTIEELHREQLRRAARIRFMLGSDRREARRRRWAERDRADDLYRDYLVGQCFQRIADETGIALTRVKELIRAMQTPEDMEERRLMMHRTRQRKSDLKRKPDLKPRIGKRAIGGYESISELARANGVKPRTMWMRLYRERTLLER